MKAIYNFFLLSLLCLCSSTMLAQSPAAAIDLEPLTATSAVVTLRAKMTPANPILSVEAVSVAVQFDSLQFNVTSPQSITNKYFTGWDDASVIPWASHVIVYGQYHPSFGSNPILRNNPPELCRFHFFPKSSAPGYADFRIYANNPTGALTYYFEFGFAQQQNFSPVNISSVQQLYYPVEMKTFTAAQQGQAVALRWVTATETNKYGYFIERRAVEVGGELDWETLHFMKGAGDTRSETQYIFFDQNLPGDGSYEYRLKQQDFDGSLTYTKAVVVEYRSRPHVFAMEQNFPNPVSLSEGTGTRISYDVAEVGTVRLVISNILGQPVEMLVNDVREPGRYAETWRPNGLPVGTYIATLTAHAPETGRADVRHIRMQIVR